MWASLALLALAWLGGSSGVVPAGDGTTGDTHGGDDNDIAAPQQPDTRSAPLFASTEAPPPSVDSPWLRDTHQQRLQEEAPLGDRRVIGHYPARSHDHGRNDELEHHPSRETVGQASAVARPNEPRGDGHVSGWMPRAGDLLAWS